MTGPKVRAAHRERSSAAKGRTNLWNKGLTSADRSNKATLPLTVPRSHSSRLQRIHPRAFNNCNSRPNRRGLSATPAVTAQCGTRAEALSQHVFDLRDVRQTRVEIELRLVYHIGRS